MIQREDFYRINQETLDSAWCTHTDRTKMYIYPQLNAIVTSRPSKAVKQYLYVEYDVNSSILKRLLIKLYTRFLLNTRGIFSTAKCTAKGTVENHHLVYPCNKKYRIFDFQKRQVLVLPKANFPTSDIQREIQFRLSNTAEFIPTILSHTETQYTEAIIDGYPLARAKQNLSAKMDEAEKLWENYVAKTGKEILSSEYAKQLRQRYEELLAQPNVQLKKIDYDNLKELETKLFSSVNIDGTVKIGLSHGDFQSGNIWIENNTGKIYIIDWEAYGIRSFWYDKCVLREGLRRYDGLVKIAQKKEHKYAVILYEDLLFRLEELKNLPQDCNSVAFNRYVQRILQEYKVNV